MYGYIYKTTNLINGKIYIGQHKSNKFDANYYGSGKSFYSAFKKYGKENFKVEILEWCETLEITNTQEKYWIEFYNSQNKEIGYNITDGGEGVSGFHLSEESRKKISKTKTGKKSNRIYKPLSEETKHKIGIGLKKHFETHDNPRKGVHLSESTKEKLRQANLGKTYSQEIRDKHKRPAWNKGIPMTEEAKQHLSKVNKGKKQNLSDEAREKKRQMFSGSNNPNYGGLKEETKDKLRKAVIGKIWVSNGKDTHQIHKEELSIYEDMGYHRGRK